MAGETLSQIRTACRVEIRDVNSATWSDTEVDQMINSAIDWLNGFYPKEQIISVPYTQPISGSVFSVTLSVVEDFWPFRVDVYDKDGKYRQTIMSSNQEGPDSGWDYFADTLFLPPHYALPTPGTLSVLGYSHEPQLSSSTQTTSLNSSALSSLRSFVGAHAFERLLSDRAAFQQWQVQSGNSDVSALSMNQITLTNQARVRQEERRLRRLRRLG
jgi:hypothetical protein